MEETEEGRSVVAQLALGWIKDTTLDRWWM
jgi:hypothetical protein